MYGVTLLIAASAIGVDYGWQPAGNGSLEYIIQIEPELVPLLEAGEAITSEIPSHLEGVRRFRIQIGDGDLPQGEAERPQEETESVADSRADATPPVPALDSPFRPHVAPAEADGTPGDFSIEGVPAENTPAESSPAESSPAETDGDTPAPAGGDTFPDHPRPLDPPREDAGNLFSGNLFPSGPAAGDTVAPPTPIEPPAASPRLELPLLDPPRHEPLVADTTEEEAGEPLFAQPELTTPELLTPAASAGSLTEFQENVSAVEEEVAESSSPEASSSEPAAETAPSSTSASAKASRPWLPLILTFVLLCLSLGGNVYLVWILLETLARYRRLRSEVATG